MRTSSNILVHPIDSAIVDTIDRVGHLMNLQTVDEFAESDSVIRALTDLRADFAQGHALQRPRPLQATAGLRSYRRNQCSKRGMEKAS